MLIIFLIILGNYIISKKNEFFYIRFVVKIKFMKLDRYEKFWKTTLILYIIKNSAYM
jgi:hypothetical protein